MKVLLLSDIKGTGKAGDIINVSDGYARNYLIPKKLAAMATETNMKLQKDKEDKAARIIEKEKQEANELKSKFENIVVNVRVKCGEGDKLFGSVTSADIADSLSAIGMAVDKRKIVLKDNIKHIGDYTVEVKLYSGISANLKLKVIKDTKEE